MTKCYNLTREDLAAFVKFHQRRWPHVNELSWPESIFLALITAFIAMGLPVAMFIKQLRDGDTIHAIMQSIWLLLIPPLLLAIFTVYGLKLRKRRLSTQLLSEAKDDGFNVVCELETDDECIKETRSTGSIVHNWSSVERVAMTPSHLFVYTSANNAYVIPRRAFEDSVEFKSFVDTIAERSGVNAILSS